MPIPVGPTPPAPSAPRKKGGIPVNLPPLASPKAELRVLDLSVPPLALWSDRTLATLIDGVLLLTPLVISILLAASASPDVSRGSLWMTLILGLLTSLVVWCGQVWLEGTRGQTIGKMILGLVVVRRQDALTIDFKDALTRNFVKLCLDIAPGGMGILSMRKDQTFHQTQGDLAVDSVVVYNERKALVEALDEKAHRGEVRA